MSDEIQNKIIGEVERHRRSVEPPLPGLDPSNVSAEYLAKLRVTALRIANDRNPGADPLEVVREATQHYNACLRFLMEDAAMTEPLIPTEDDYELVNKNQDDAIAELVDAVVGREAPRAPYGELVYKAAWKLAEACKASEAVYNYRLTDIEEYTEVERRRQIGLTIDPATAETTFWWADINDPYCILNQEEYQCVGRERFARNPGASNDDWVVFWDLPEATCEALWERDGPKLMFPYGLSPDDDIINYPPAVQSGNPSLPGERRD